MVFERLQIPDLILITPKVHGDYRGIFFESYNAKNFINSSQKSIAEELSSVNFIQDNIATSIKKNTIRGMHFQLTKPQAKFVTCIKGSILDVVIDIRPESQTYKQWLSVTLDDQHHQQLFVPRGFAHGYKSISDDAVVMYKADEYYDPSDYRGIKWNDESLLIDWELDPSCDEPIISKQDQNWEGI